jgi:hypothetical protein
MTTLFNEPGSPLENGDVESLNGGLRDELIDCETFHTLAEARALGYRPAAKVSA